MVKNKLSLSFIRYRCYQMMNEIAQILGNEFEAYRTDCIYYRDTKENRELVQNYLKEHGFDFKQLVYGDEDDTNINKDIVDNPE